MKSKFFAALLLLLPAAVLAETGKIGELYPNTALPNSGNSAADAGAAVLSALLQMPGEKSRNARTHRELVMRSFKGTCQAEYASGGSLPCTPMDFVVSEVGGKDIGFFRTASDGSFSCVMQRPGNYAIRPRSAKWVLLGKSPQTFVTGAPLMLKVTSVLENGKPL